MRRICSRLMLCGLALTACNKAESERLPKNKVAQAAAESPQPEPAPAAVAEEPPLALPAGQTPGDLFLVPPKLPPRLTTGGDGGQPAVPTSDCADAGPSGALLVKHLELTLPAAKPGEAPQVVQACLFQNALERTDRTSHSGKQFHIVAVWPGDVNWAMDVAEPEREPSNLPPERSKAGHDATAWGTLIATRLPETPVLAVISSRFIDGNLGEVLQWRRQARLLHVGKGWLPFEGREFSSVDGEHLRQLCEGKAEYSPADKAAGALQLACDRLSQWQPTHEEQQQAHLTLRNERLLGKGSDAVTAAEEDPQSAWLLAGKRALAKGDWATAAQMALRVEMVCGEPVTEAHALLSEVAKIAALPPIRVQPAQNPVAMCEPLPDKIAPRRKVAEVPKSAGKAGAESAGKPAPTPAAKVPHAERAP